MKLRNLPFRLESELFKRWYAQRGLRPSSAPYLSGDTFRSLTPWRWEGKDGGGLDVTQIPDQALVYVEGWHLRSGLEALATGAPRKFRVISGNGAVNFTPDKLGWIGPNITRLWIQNLMTVDPRLEALPVGLENACRHVNGIVADFERLRKRPVPTQNRVLWGFAETTNPAARGAARRGLEACSVAERLEPVNARTYRKVLARYRFVASPPGRGEDCHRTWEAFYLRVVPIVVRSPLTEAFARWGLPIWLVDGYEELQGLSEHDLSRRYEELSPAFDHPRLWLEAWKKELQP